MIQLTRILPPRRHLIATVQLTGTHQPGCCYIGHLIAVRDAACCMGLALGLSGFDEWVYVFDRGFLSRTNQTT